MWFGEIIMKKSSKKKSYIIIVVAIIFIFVLLKIIYPKTATYEKNANEFTDAFKIISFNQDDNEEIIIEDLSSYIQFNWDKVLFFGPYVSEERIYEIVGYKWRNSLLTNISEGMNQVVFLENNEVVCHIQGYPDQYGVSFRIQDYLEADEYPEYSEILNQDKIQVSVRNNDEIYYIRFLSKN